MLQFDAGEDVVECEVFENEAFTLFSGWQPAPALPGQRLKYSNRKGELSSAEFPDVRRRILHYTIRECYGHACRQCTFQSSSFPIVFDIQQCNLKARARMCLCVVYSRVY